MECTPDELASLVREIQDSNLVRGHTYHLKNYKNTIVGHELVSWFMEHKGLSCEPHVHGPAMIIFSWICVYMYMYMYMYSVQMYNAYV